MNQFSDQVTAFAASQQPNAPAAEPATPAPTTEIVTEQVIEPSNVPTPPAEAQDAPAAEVQTPAPATEGAVLPDHNAILDEISGGAFKTVDDFKASLSKFQGYDTLLSEKAQLEEKLNQDPFASDYVKQFNDFVKAGATKDQIKTFQRVNELGDPAQMTPVEAKIAHMVLVEGYNEDRARLIVNNDFPVDDFAEGTDDRLMIEEKLRVSAEQAKNGLKQYIAASTTIDNTAQEQARLAEIAKKSEFVNQVKAAVPQIAQTMTGLGEFNVNGKEGEEAVKMTFDYPKEFAAEIPAMLETFFTETGKAPTPEAIAEAQGYIAAHYAAKHYAKDIQAAWKAAESATWEKAVNKYENRSGLPQQSAPPVVENQAGEYNSFLQRVAGVNKR